MTPRPPSHRRPLLVASLPLLLLGAARAHAIGVDPIDLTTAGSSGTTGDGVIWSQQTLHPTGTGVYQPFLRLQDKGDESGMNTDAKGANKIEDDKGGVWTHSVQFSELQTVEVGDVSYYSFDLDINEPQGNGKSLLSLDQFQLYAVTGDPALSSLAALQAMGTLLYDLDAGGDNRVFLDSAIQPGSGHDDMNVLIPVSYFAAAHPSDYLYLHSSFGETGGYAGNSYLSEGGFEEWRAKTVSGGGVEPPPPAGAPEPSTLLHLASGSLLGVAMLRRRLG